MKQNIANALDDTDTLYGRVFNWVITALILISVVAFTLETLPDLPLWMMETLKWIEVTTVALFTIEYVLRIWTSQRPLQYIFSFYGLVDLLAIIPFYLPTSLDLRTIRALRLLRLFKLLRFTKAVNRFRRAFGDIREELMVFGITSMITLYLASVGIYFCESEAPAR